MKMKLILRFTLLLLLTTAGQLVFAQSNKEKALKNGMQALKLEDEGKMDESIKLWEEAQKLDPKNANYPYELAYVYYKKQDYQKAINYLEGILSYEDLSDRVYQLLGNSYDNIEKSDKAMEVYEVGLKKFPNSGNLYLEMGVLQMTKKEYEKALIYYEKGIEVAPLFSSNYYWAARIYCGSTEEVWGMIYGEIFMNIERNSSRTAEISKLLYDTYKSQITISSDTSVAVSFSKNATINVTNLSDPTKIQLPFGLGCYEPTLLMSIINIKAININSLDTIRRNFVDVYFKNGMDKKYPNILFDYQHKIYKAGHMEAYNHWVLMKGDEDGFKKWLAAGNNAKWDNFVSWFVENKLPIDTIHKFYSGQY